jgi:hypothetical protein
MLFNVPQYIDIEDKVAGPFTAKQLLWMFGMGGVLLMLWGLLDKITFFIAAIPVALIFCALAFYRPQGQPLIKFFFWGIAFIFHPKTYIWKRIYAKKKPEKKIEEHLENVLEKKQQEKKEILTENIEAFSRTLDSEGKERSNKIMEIIKNNRQAYSKR